MPDLKARVLFKKPDFIKVPPPPVDSKDALFIVVKFHEGTKLKLTDGKLELPVEKRSQRDTDMLKRLKLDEPLIAEQHKKLRASLDAPRVQVERLFQRSEDALAKDHIEAEAMSKEEHADPNLYYYVSIRKGSPAQVEQLVNDLNASPLVETAYIQPKAFPPWFDIAPVTPNLGLSTPQGHLNPASAGGIDARYAWTFDGGKGQGVRIIDVEWGWHLDHEDLPRDYFFNGSGLNIGEMEHGTAVLGVVGAVENQYGLTGIAPRAELGVATVFRLSFTPVAWAIDEAASHLRAGDIIIIEQHAHGPSTGLPPDDGNPSQWEFVCMEYWQAEFDAIRRASARGIIVVEAGGNGGMDLDSPLYEGRFNRSIRDSGAILVGAGTSNGRAAHRWSNYGSRVDVQGWGDSVVTLGYGNLARVNGDDTRQWYTSSFSGTSSASPIVAGAIACIQGALKALGRPVLSPRQMRDVLVETGSAQAPGRHIGPLPNLHAAYDRLGIPHPPATGWPSLGGTIISPPTVAQNRDGRLEVFALGTDERLWHIWQTAPSNGWSAWAPIGDARFAGKPVVGRNSDGRLEVFVRGTDGYLYHVWQTSPGGGWSGWDRMGAIIQGDPAVVSNLDGRLEVFVRGLDNRLWRNWQMWAGGNWFIGGFQAMGGGITGSPAAGRNADGRLEVFVRNLDNVIYHSWQTSPGGGWAGWDSLSGGVATSDPSVINNADGRMEVCIRGLDGAFWHIWQTMPSGGWAGWTRRGGELAEGAVIALASSSTGPIEAYARFRDGSIRRLQQASGWGAWESLGGVMTSDPTVGRNSDGRMEVFARGSSRDLAHRWQTSPGGGWNG